MRSAADDALLAGVATGDESSTVAFVRRYQHRVYGLALGVLGDTAAAEEVAQEALLRVWRHAATYDARRGSVTTWVLTITRHLAIDALRARRSTPVAPDDPVFVSLVSPDRPADELAAAGDARPALRRALAALPVEQRRALVLAAIYGRTAAEISQVEAVPLGTAKTRIRTALIKVRQLLAEAGMAEDRPADDRQPSDRMAAAADPGPAGQTIPGAAARAPTPPEEDHP
jgi:RNA polymerase sigma-70 factor (ECF subfamily)